jgi:hypothetical protein
VISRPTLLAILALPAGAIGYVVTANVLSGLGLGAGAEGILLIFIPLLVAGLCMAPFLLPLFDRMAKRDLAELAAHRAEQAAVATAATDDSSPSLDADPSRGPERP